MENYEDSNENRMSYYLEIGAIELAGVDESGEMIFEIKEEAKDIAPELWQAHMEYVDNNLIELYKQGYLEVEYDDNLEALINLSPEGFKIAKERGLIPLDVDRDVPND